MVDGRLAIAKLMQAPFQLRLCRLLPQQAARRRRPRWAAFAACLRLAMFDRVGFRDSFQKKIYIRSCARRTPRSDAIAPAGVKKCLVAVRKEAAAE